MRDLFKSKEVYKPSTRTRQKCSRPKKFYVRKEEGYDQRNRGLKYKKYRELKWHGIQNEGERNEMGIQGRGRPGRATLGRKR